MTDKLNTAEYDHKGRCVRHPAIRLRKKKLFGGWKIIIGHCPECCLDEMRRVRDEIGAEQDDDDSRGHGGDHPRNHDGERRRERKHHKKKHRHRDRDRRHRDGRRSGGGGGGGNDSVSEVGSEPHMSPEPAGGPYRGHPQAGHDGSEATGSTAQNSSMDGNGSVVSEQYARGGYAPHASSGRDMYYQQAPPPPPRMAAAAPPAAQRTMVLSMAFTDPQTGQRGTYTGQVNSINHKPDGKGTVYYANGNIAEGTWSNGLLVEGEDDGVGPPAAAGYEQRGRAFPPPPPPPDGRARSSSRGHRTSDPPMGGSGHSGRSSRSSRSASHQPPPFTGNLDRLDQLGGRPRGGPRGASASVQSYNSRGSRGDPHLPSGSASVQDYGGRQAYVAGGGGSVMSGGQGSQGGYQRSGSGYHRGGGHRGGNPPGYR